MHSFPRAKVGSPALQTQDLELNVCGGGEGSALENVMLSSNIPRMDSV